MVVGEWACGAVAHGAVRRGESGSRAFVGDGRLAACAQKAGADRKSLVKYVDEKILLRGLI